MDTKSSKFSLIPFYIYGTLWCIGGLLYAYAGAMVQTKLGASFAEPFTYVQPFLQNAARYANVYMLVFFLFTLADLALALIGASFYQHLAIKDNRALFIMLLFLLSGFMGALVDLILLSFWHMVNNSFLLNLTPVQWQDLWSLFLLTEYIGVWISAAGFVTGTVAFYLLYSVTKANNKFPKAWVKCNLLLSILSGLSVLAIVYAMAGGTGAAISGIFFLATVIAAPVWAFWSANILKKVYP